MQRIVKREWRITRIALVYALFLLTTPVCPTAEPLLQKPNLFTEGTDGFRLYRIPGIVLTAN